MAARLRKRLSKNENKLLKLEKLKLEDIICSICQSVLIRPVTLPCYHDFCYSCFNGSIQNNALCCPLCRLRIGSWLRNASKQKNVVNVELWDYIKLKFNAEVNKKMLGEDLELPQEKPLLRLSAPGEIKSEYEAELRRLQAERLQLENRHIHETELLIKKLQLEEEQAHAKYLERLKQDEFLAQQIHNESLKDYKPAIIHKKNILAKSTVKKKVSTIDNYLSKVKVPVIKESPLITDDNTSTDSSTPNCNSISNSKCSPEMIPSYSKFIKNIFDKKMKTVAGIWNKENGDGIKKNEMLHSNKELEISEEQGETKPKSVVHSLPVSLPYTGILQHKKNENRNIDTGSVDSMRQELCYFKPIEVTTNTTSSTKLSSSVPLRVPGVRGAAHRVLGPMEPEPSRAAYLEGLCRLRHLSLASNLPSAFVIALNLLRAKKDISLKCDLNTKSRIKKTTVPIPSIRKITTTKTKDMARIDEASKLKQKRKVRRTRSVGSISRNENETTPKKVKLSERKVCSERKPYLRSDSKRLYAKRESRSSTLTPEPTNNNNKLNLAVKNLSSPLKNCDVKKILEDQIRIEKLIEQEKSDYEFACKMDAEWNGRRQLRRAGVKRQVTINYALRPAKKLKV